MIVDLSKVGNVYGEIPDGREVCAVHDMSAGGVTPGLWWVGGEGSSLGCAVLTVKCARFGRFESMTSLI